MTVPTIGRIVHYKLSQQDAVQINAQRQPTYRESQPGLIGPGNKVTPVYTNQGNPVSPGDIYPLLITSVWGDTEGSAVNGQVLLDGNDSLWVTSVCQHVPTTYDGIDPSLVTYELPERSWVFPPRV